MMSMNIEIFRTGTHTDSQGKTFEASEEMVKGIVARYNAANAAAPLVLGHPETDDPAYGWVKGLEYRPEDGVMQAEVGDIHPDLELMVRDGRFKNVSVALDWDANNNPKLRHVAFLGARLPAVSGLQPVTFSGEPAATFEFAGGAAPADDGAFNNIMKLLRRIASSEQKVSPLWALNGVREDGVRPREADNRSAFADKGGKDMPNATTQESKAAEPAPPEERNKVAAEFAAEDKKTETKVVSLEKKLAEFAAEQKLSRAQTLVAGLVGRGTITPKQSSGLAEFVAALPDEKTLCFAASSSDGKEEKLSPLAFFEKFLGALPRRVSYEEAAGNGGGGYGNDAEELGAEAAAYMAAQIKAGRIVSASQAVEHVKNKGGSNG